MISLKKQKQKYYRSLDEISIYNWVKLTDDNDFKYLCVGNNKPDSKAIEAYQNLLFQFDIIDLETLKERRSITIQAIDILQQIINDNDIDFESIKYISVLIRGVMIMPSIESLKTLSKLIRSNDIKFNLSLLENEVMKIKKQENISTKKDIYDKCAELSKAMNGLQIDPKTTSVRQYLAYEKTIINELKKQTNGTGATDKL